ncbi:hypothetical protein L211DRAFT_405883 [Terfezia boudieri ATCC MYA-4762]|uniref:Uncharacterized protein n=1 Tax=Terfezia boudieri ATCC MYA-4762 TaxID=1051890 RepID=A0A3N4M848_9PEZI|nr:hypothetical protein L211DRAFT_405883 [Terfezia boudieri ATCC MYA-4762]
MPPKRKAQRKRKVEEIASLPEISTSQEINVETSATTTTTRRSARVAAGKNKATAPAVFEAASAITDSQESAKHNVVRKKSKTKASNSKAEALAPAPATSLNAAASISGYSGEATVSKESATTPVAPTPENAPVALQPAVPPITAPPTSMPPPAPPPPPASSSSTVRALPIPESASAPQPKKRVRNSAKMLANNNIRPPLPSPDSIEYMRCGILIQDDEDEDEDLEQPESEDPNEKTPPPGSPASKWFISKLGADRLRDMCEDCMKRCPDAFGMYIFNDFWGYGIIEVMENWALDWARSWDRYKSWKGGKLNRMAMAKGFGQHYMVDDGERVMELYELLTAMLSGTFRLLNDIHETHKSEENPRPLAPIKNLGLMCACALNHHSSINPDDENVDFRPMVYRYAKRWGELEDDYVREMVEKGIKVDEIDEEEEEEEEDDKKLSIEACVRAEKMLAEYKARHASSPPGIFYRPPRIGGNSYDITKMNEAEKREYKYGSRSSPSPW